MRWPVSLLFPIRRVVLRRGWLSQEPPEGLLYFVVDGVERRDTG